MRVYINYWKAYFYRLYKFAAYKCYAFVVVNLVVCLLLLLLKLMATIHYSLYIYYFVIFSSRFLFAVL